MNKNDKSAKKYSNSKSRRGGQPRKDDSAKRINADNERVSKFDKKLEKSENKWMNDFSWYNKYPNLITGAARIPFGNLVGQYDPAMGNTAVPGIMVLTYDQTIGGALEGFVPSSTSTAVWNSVGINQAAESRYSFVVHANSRNNDYDAADMMLVCVAGASIYSLISYGERAFGTMQGYSPDNKYLPEALITASGFDFADLQSNYSHMWFDLNQRIARANQIWIPKDLPIIQRWFWMNGAYYKDSNSAKAQIYLFKPGSYLKYDELTFPTGPSLKRTDLTGNLTWDQYLGVLDECLAALLDTMDRGTMYGDILKAYGAGNLFALNEVPLDYKIAPVYQPEVLTQIENCSPFVNNSSYAKMANIVQYEGILYQNWAGAAHASTPNEFPSAQLRSWASPGAGLLNFHDIADPTVQDITVATRLKPAQARLATIAQVVKSSGTSAQLIPVDAIVPYACGTELIRVITSYNYNYSFPGSTSKSLVGTDVTAFETSNNQYSALWSLMAFDWAPWFVHHNVPIQEGTDILPNSPAVYDTAYAELYGDWDVYTFIDDESLKRIHLAADFSLWGMLTF